MLPKTGYCDWLLLSPHLHVVALDGVYVAGTEEQPVFHPLSHLRSDEVADVLQIAKTRMLKALARLGAVEVRPDALAVDDAWAARDPVMAHLAAAAVAGLPAPSGPRACPPCPCPTRLRRARRRGPCRTQARRRPHRGRRAA